MIAGLLSAMEPDESRPSEIFLGNWENKTPHILSFGQKFGKLLSFDSSQEFVRLLPPRQENRKKFLGIKLGPIPLILMQIIII